MLFTRNENHCECNSRIIQWNFIHSFIYRMRVLGKNFFFQPSNKANDLIWIWISFFFSSFFLFVCFCVFVNLTFIRTRLSHFHTLYENGIWISCLQRLISFINHHQFWFHFKRQIIDNYCPLFLNCLFCFVDLKKTKLNKPIHQSINQLQKK